MPSAVRSRMENVDVVVRQWPSRDDLERAGLQDPEGLLGLYQGIPLTERNHYDMVLPDVITLFQGPIQARCSSAEQAVEEIRVTVVHEVAHHFGIGDDALNETPYR